MIARAGQAAGLVLVWLAVLTSTKPGDVLLGVLVAIGVLLVPRPGGHVQGGGATDVLQRTARFPRFVAAVLWDVTRGTWDVALRVLHLRGVERPGFVEVPIGERTDLGVAVSALTTTLSPGSVLVDIDRERRVMLLHVIDASDPDAVRADLQHFYEHAQRGVVP